MKKAKDCQRCIEILEGLKMGEIKFKTEEIVLDKIRGTSTWNACVRQINQQIQETINQLKDEK
jgi:hypothetical protein